MAIQLILFLEIAAVNHGDIKLSLAKLFWRSALVHFKTGNDLVKLRKFAEAEAAYRKAIELKPDSVGAYINLGTALLVQEKYVDAEEVFRKAFKHKPNDSVAYLIFCKLGRALASQGKHAEADETYRKAIELQPDRADAYLNLGIFLSDQAKHVEAEAVYRKGIDRNPNDAVLYINLGAILNDLNRNHVEAEAAFRKAIKLKPDDFDANFNLGVALRGQGRFDESLAAFRRAHELGSTQSDIWRSRALQMVNETQRFVQLERRLPAILQGKSSPANVEETVTLSRMCHCKKQYTVAARLYADAFTTKPALANDLTSEFRYDAACSAAQGGCGKGEDVAKLDKKEQARWRNKALEWLRADLELHREQLNGPDAKTASQRRRQLAHWQTDPYLDCVRDEKELAKLPEEERREWRNLWKEVERVLKP